VRGIPALFLFRQGDLVSQKAGALPAQTLVSWISGELGVSAQNGRSK
jgi:thioredoxin-like negative regulator of GroEL